MSKLIEAISNNAQGIQALCAVAMLLVSCVLGLFTWLTSKRQIQLSNDSLKIQLYKQRLEIYKRLEKILMSCLGNIDENVFDPIHELANIMDEVKFLFGTKTQRYVIEIINKVSSICLCKENHIYVDKHLLDWLNNQISEEMLLRKHFATYLDLSTYGINKAAEGHSLYNKIKIRLKKLLGIDIY